MKIHLVFLTSIIALSSIVHATDEASPIPEPDHLKPVGLYQYQNDLLTRYRNQIRSRLKLDSYFFAQMLVMPSFGNEFVVRLHGKAKGEDDFTRASQFFLTYSVADQSIWYSMPENNGNHRQGKVKISSSSDEIAKPLATRLLRLWEQMLLRTRYREQDVVSSREGEGIVGTDGTTFEFAVWNARGETWSPEQRKSPLLLVEIGESLVKYCNAKPQEKPDAMKEIETKAAQLEEYLTEHPPQ
jgi:hypothetical protein